MNLIARCAGVLAGLGVLAWATGIGPGGVIGTITADVSGTQAAIGLAALLLVGLVATGRTPQIPGRGSGRTVLEMSVVFAGSFIATSFALSGGL